MAKTDGRALQVCDQQCHNDLQSETALMSALRLSGGIDASRYDVILSGRPIIAGRSRRTSCEQSCSQLAKNGRNLCG